MLFRSHVGFVEPTVPLTPFDGGDGRGLRTTGKGRWRFDESIEGPVSLRSAAVLEGVEVALPRLSFGFGPGAIPRGTRGRSTRHLSLARRGSLGRGVDDGPWLSEREDRQQGGDPSEGKRGVGGAWIVFHRGCPMELGCEWSRGDSNPRAKTCWTPPLRV